MKARVIRWLRALLLWLDPPPKVVPFPAPVLDPLDAEADRLVREADQMRGGPDGEYKRHVVYSRLLKLFPDRRKRDVAFAIELAIQAKG